MKMVLWLSVTALLLSSLTMELHSVHSLQVQPTPKPTPADVKLVKGSSHCSGALWKKNDNGKWAKVRVAVNVKEAHEVCRQLDCGPAISAKTIGRNYKAYVEVICSESVRLVNGTGLCSGRVEVKSNQSWVSVCESDFGQQDAEVVCRQLGSVGCGTYPVLLGAFYGEANVPVWTKEFQCEGNETVLLDCRASHSTRNTCSPDKAVGLTCSGLRLVHETSKCIGTLQDKPDGEWRAINVYDNNNNSNHIWELMKTHHMCRQLDCGSATSGGTGFWFLKNYYTVEVICSDVRLVGGASDCNGTLEKKLDGEWSPVHDDDYKLKQKEVQEVCQQLDCGTAVSRKTSKIEPDGKHTKVEVICSESVRLVNGTSVCSGTVEVKSNQSWVSVCEGDFDQQDAEVVCRTLGCGIPSVLQGALYGEANVPMWTKELQCEGSESVLLDCRTSDSTRNTCSPDKAVGLTCSDYSWVEPSSKCFGKLVERNDGGLTHLYNKDHIWNLMKENNLCRQLDCGSAPSGIWIYRNGRVELICLDLRLVGGTSDCDGTLEKKEDGKWATLHDQDRGIDLRTAHEVCRLLDCGSAVSTETIGVWSSDPKITKMICSESVRLVNGPSEYSGRVEVKSNQSWVSVCEGDFNQQDAEVVCRQLGGGTHAVLQSALYGEGNVTMWTREFHCEGNESVILDCKTSNSTRNTCSPDKAVGLTCSEFRLVGGISNCAGVLEMEIKKVWRPTFDRYRDWDMKDSHVVCRQLGCGHALDLKRTSGSKRHAVWHTISNCLGSEAVAKDCISKEWTYSGTANDLWEITCSGNL